jgi:Mce-associated membrane protein
MTRFRKADPLLITAVAAVVVAAVCAAWSGWSWSSAAQSRSLGYSRTRDQALRDGEQAVQNLNTLDYRNVAAGLAVWQESSTGTLHTDLVQAKQQYEQVITELKTVTSAKILDGALTQLDTHAGTATIMVAVQLTVVPSNGKPVTKLEREEGALASTGSGWKLSDLTYPAVGVATPAPSNPASPSAGPSASR